jgi:PAT family beta-lactamase induction signal transducer AmpG
MISETGLPVSSGKSPKSAHPILFFFFYMPFGVFSGYVTVTLAFLFSKSGVSLQQIAGLAAINLLPQVFKFLWAPLVDTTLTVKRWYLLSTLVTAATIFATGIIPINASNLFLFSCMVLISSFARSFISAAIGGLAAGTSQKLKGRMGGYCQAGNLGGGAIGGGAGLWLAQHVSYTWLPGATLALVCVLCCAGLLFISEPVSTIRAERFGKNIRNVVADVWATLKTNRGFLAFILNLLPLGTGAAGFLFAAVAKDWRSGADTVALVTGGLGGLAIIIGCLIGGPICDRVNRQKAFVLFSLLQGICCVGMAFSPHVPLMYILWTLGYAFVNGFVNAAYSSFNLEAAADGAAASKFELYSSMAYLPLYLMFWISAGAYAKWGAFGMLNMEAAIATLAAGLYLFARISVKRRRLMREDSSVPAGVPLVRD